MHSNTKVTIKRRGGEGKGKGNRGYYISIEGRRWFERYPLVFALVFGVLGIKIDFFERLVLFIVFRVLSFLVFVTFERSTSVNNHHHNNSDGFVKI